MPAASSRRSTATAGPSLTPLRPSRVPVPTRKARVGPVRVTPAAVTAPPVKHFDPDEACCVCLSPLSDKREASLVPCSHKFHETCARNWLETREFRMEQSCPMCRTRVKSYVDHMGNSVPPPILYGDNGEPRDLALLYGRPSALVRVTGLIKREKMEIGERLTRCYDAEARARHDERSEEYMEDIEEERKNLVARWDKLDWLLERYKCEEAAAQERLERQERQYWQERLERLNEQTMFPTRVRYLWEGEEGRLRSVPSAEIREAGLPDFADLIARLEQAAQAVEEVDLADRMGGLGLARTPQRRRDDLQPFVGANSPENLRPLRLEHVRVSRGSFGRSPRVFATPVETRVRVQTTAPNAPRATAPTRRRLHAVRGSPGTAVAATVTAPRAAAASTRPREEAHAAPSADYSQTPRRSARIAARRQSVGGRSVGE